MKKMLTVISVSGTLKIASVEHVRSEGHDDIVSYRGDEYIALCGLIAGTNIIIKESDITYKIFAYCFQANNASNESFHTQISKYSANR